jgi:hypothetical protein
MTTYQTQDLFTEILEGKPLPPEKLEYFRARLRLQIHDLVASRFDQQETLNQADYARRIHRKPEAINRLLSAPGNWTLDTLSDLMVGLGFVFTSFTDTRVADLIATRPETPDQQSEVSVPTPSGARGTDSQRAGESRSIILGQ